MNNVLSLLVQPYFFYTILRLATPLIFAAMAALVSTKSGLSNIIIDGTMLMSAVVGTIASALTNSLFWGAIAGMATGLLMSYGLAFFHLKFKAPANLTGVAINLFTSNFSVFVCYEFSGDKGSTMQLHSLSFPTVDIPIIKDIPFIGQVLSGHNIITYMALLSIILVYILIYKTRLGLRIRTVGENPNAASSVGIVPQRMQTIAILISGILASWGGMFLSMGYATNWTRNMTSARGFIGVAANAVGGGNPLWVTLTTFIFAISSAMNVILQALMIPTEFTSMVPFVFSLSLVVLTSFFKKLRKEKQRKDHIALVEAEMAQKQA